MLEEIVSLENSSDPNDNLIVLARERRAVRNLLDQVTAPVARHVLIGVSEAITGVMVNIAKNEADRILIEDGEKI